MNIVFMGTPEFAVPSLKKLIKEYGIKAVFTQPDRPKGRGNKISMSSVKNVAVEYGIPVYQPEKIKNEPHYIDILKKIEPDFIIVVAFGQILPKEILDIPKYGCINLHASLLPRYRGAAPINWVVINGERETGNTTMFMSEGLDCGDILLKSRIAIGDNMTAGELHDALMQDGSELLVNTIERILDGSIVRIPQNEAETCNAPMINKETGKINWNLSNKVINNLIRGLNPSPAAHTQYKDVMLKIFEAQIVDEEHKYQPGFIIDVSNDGIKVACKDGALLIKKLQFPGKKPMKVEDYLRGNAIEKEILLK